MTTKTTKNNEPKNQTRLVASGKLSDDTLYRIHTERVDKRRDKDYARQVTIAVVVANFETYSGQRAYNDYDGPGKVEAFEAFLPETLRGAVFATTHWPYNDDERALVGEHENGRVKDRIAIFSVTIPFVADKPSEIIDTDEALHLLDAKLAGETEYAKVLDAIHTATGLSFPGGRAANALGRAVHAYREQHDEARAADKRRRAAAHIAKLFANQADEAARKVVRFEQRLAALVAELDAEQKVQASEIVEKHSNADEPHKYAETNEEIEPEVIKAALNHVAEFLPSAISRGFPRGIDSGEDKIDIEEVL